MAVGVVCISIGLLHLALGVASVPGEGRSEATVRWLAGICLLGGIGRILSMVLHGRPQSFQMALTAMELLLPPVFFWLAAAGVEDSPISEACRSYRSALTISVTGRSSRMSHTTTW